ncbi:hypothetical protein ASPCAL08913 [Aspergillus calidoustus]|uniref:Uncharacterized protein n=1 Tax=Aspergillus calidoustus TaxID=454130 RepID=A0A0U5GXW5_ASPCI|nr:hypothetical protein ASPCAL08913 [Aspergillus calidoustus]
MPFSSFSTSILYGGDGVSSVQQAAQTADADRGNYSDIACHSNSQDCSRFPHCVHEFAKRDVKPENKTAVAVGSVNDTNAGNATLAKPPKSPATQWSTDKASIAASTLFAAFATTAVIFMTVLCIKRYRKRRRRKKLGNADLIAAEEKKRKRESLMFCRDQPRTYVIEQNRNGEVTRVRCTGNTSPGAGSPLESVSSIQPDMRIEATRHLAELYNTNSGRSGSIPQPVVIISPPLEPVVSRAAVPSTQTTESIESIDQDRQTGSSKFSETTVSPKLEPTESKQSTTGSSTSNGTRRMSLLRLPPIRQSMSPLFRF